MFKDKLNKYLSALEEANEFSGVVLIKKGEEELYSNCFGYSNRNFNVSNKINTKFRIASVSKMFTAVAILQLVEKGLISLNTKVKEYLNLSNTKIPDDVNIHHLLTHSSGISDYYDESLGDEEWERMWKQTPIYNVQSLNDYLYLFKDKEPVFNAGKKFHYNGAGYILLGLVIEKASRSTYFDYIKKYIFNKANMLDSDFLNLDQAYDRVAEGYEKDYDDNDNIIWKRNIYTVTPTAASDGGATSTAYDLIKFIQSLKEYKLVNKELTRLMLTPHVIDEKSDGYREYNWKYGYANQIITKANKVVRGGHTGEEYGFSSRLYYYPEYDLDVVILANQGFCAGKIGWEIHDLITKQ